MTIPIPETDPTMPEDTVHDGTTWDNLREAYDTIRAKAVELNHKNHNLQAELTALKSRHSDMADLYRNLDDRSNVLASQAAAAEPLRQQNANLKSNLSSHADTVKRLTADVDSHAATIRNLEDMSEGRRRGLADATENLVAARETLSTYSATFVRQRDDLRSANNRNDKLAAKVAALDALKLGVSGQAWLDLKAQLELTETMLEQTRDKLTAEQGKCLTLQGMNDNQCATIREAQLELADAQEARQLGKEVIEKLERELWNQRENHRAECEALKTTIAKERTHRMQKVSLRENERVAYGEAVKAHENIVGQLTIERDNARKDRHEVERMLDNAQQCNDSAQAAREDIVRLTGQLTGAYENNHNLTETVAALRSKVDVLEGHKRAYDADIAKTQGRLVVATSELAAVNERLTLAEETTQAVRTDHQSTQVSLQHALDLVEYLR